MIQMQLTDAGLAAITRNENITFTKFVTGSGTEGTDHIVFARQDVPISYSQTYIKGQSYLINGVQTTVNYNAVELVGTLSSAQASESYTWTELALMAREGAGQEYTFAYGISVNNAYHVNPAEPVTFVIPFSVIFTATPNVTVQTTETGVSWSAFMEHANLNVITGAHGLEVKNGRIYVNNIELDIASQTALVTDINTLRAEMQLADGDLADSISSLEDTVDSEVNTLQGNIDTVAGNLTSSVSTINSRITSEVSTLNDTITSEANTLDTKIDSEVSTLQGNIDTLSDSLTSNVNTLDARITSEANTLDTKIDTQVSTLDTKIDTEAGTLDAKIDSEVDTLEGTISDNYTALTGLIDTTSTALQNNIDTQTAALLLDLNNRTKNILGVDIIVDALPLNPIDYLGQVALLTTDDKWYRSEYRDVIEPGDWIKAVDGVWRKVTSDTEDAMLVVADDAELGNMEIHVSDAQAYFTIWSPLRGVNIRLEDLESTTTNYLTYKELDDAEYNDEIIIRMTGSGTAADPYLIYTPMDFEQIRSGGENQYKYYRIVNNLDFSKAIGIKVNETDGEIQYETVDSTAPLFNEGKGFIPFGTQRYMNLDGGNHTIKNLIIADNVNQDKCGIFREIYYTSISNLIIKDSYLTYTWPRNARIGSISGWCENVCYLTNIVSHMKIYANVGDYEAAIGGIVGGCKFNCTFTNCAFHGSMKASRLYSCYFGGVVSYDESTDDNQNDKSKFVCCYNTANLYGTNVCGIGRKVLIARNCYNSGLLETSDPYHTDWSNSITNLLNQFLIIENCYCLEGSAGTVQGTVLTDSQLKSPSAVDKLNTDLAKPSWVSSEGGYPMLDFEMLNEANLKPSIPIAAVDPASKLVINSGYTIGRLLHLPSEASITELRRDVDSKSSVSKLSITLASDGWSDSLQTVSSLSSVTAESVLVLIPKSADTFTNGISITAQAEGSITFGCSSTPSNDIPVDVIVIN